LESELKSKDQPNGLEIQNKVNADLKQLAKEEGLQLPEE